MKATQNQQQDLLHLHTLATEIERTRVSIGELLQSAEIASKRQAQLLKANELITAHNELETIDLELRRANSDLDLVEQRISRDEDRLNSTASSKDAQGIQNEIESLKKRKSDLEDVSLVVIEQQESAQSKLSEISTEKATIDSELAELEAAAQKEVMKLKSSGELLVQEFTALKARIAPEHLEKYTKLAARGVPIGRLEGRDCGACRMALGASAYESVISLPADEFATCTECSALLVRG
ncbi:MAG: hypothetical protein RL196_1045 [Actinomycetota bacterium]|jgi:predicted  nucleic acid-binding Zn-ribbon protein